MTHSFLTLDQSYHEARMLTSEFDYKLPPELIAQRPLAKRDAARMLAVDRARDGAEDRQFRDLPSLLSPGDLLVFNNTKVFPARLLGRRLGTGAQRLGKRNPGQREFLQTEIEALLVRHEGGPGDEHVWRALVRPGRKVRPGEVLVFGEDGGEDALRAEVLGRGPYGERRLRFTAVRAGSTVEAEMDRLGHVPLPPYIRRPDDAADSAAYQTVYAKVRGAVAAPTAGLHFSEEVISTLKGKGIESAEITLHVGLGTFRPVRTGRVEDHPMDAEAYEISAAAAEKIQQARQEKRRVVAVGTTCVRTLEHAVRVGEGRIRAGGGETKLFIYPGFVFEVTQALLTNFHLPCSTLLMLVAAFAGRDLIFRAYRHAVRERYRFYSYGDCMLIT